MNAYKSEFPHYDDTLTLPEGWVDTSWHNDVCPSFEKLIGDMRYRIWCDFKDPELREVGGRRFNVAFYDSNEFEELQDIKGFDTLDEALSFFNQEVAQ